MADIKQKPKMDAPKVKSKDTLLPREAGRMLAQEYQRAAQERSESPGRPEQEGVRQVEDGLHSTMHRGMNLAKQTVQGTTRKKYDNKRNAARPTQAGRLPLGDVAQNTSDGAPSDKAQQVNSLIRRQQEQQAVRKQSIRKSMMQAQVKERAANQEVQMRNDSRRMFDGSGGRVDSMGTGNLVKTVKQKSPAHEGAKGKPTRRTFSLKAKNGMSATPQQSATAAKKVKHRAVAVKRAAEVAQKTAKATVHAAKRIAAVVAKAAAALGKAIMAAASAVGPAVLIFIVVAAIAAVLASPFGIFFSAEDEESKSAMQQVVSAISYDYNQNIHDIIGGNAHDEMRFSFINHGYSRTDNWIDVLAVYAIHTANLRDDGIEVLTLDDTHIEKLRAVFWDMQDVSYEVKNEPIYDPETDTSTDHHVLYIRAECIGAGTMADSYRFSRDQREILAEMLSGEYDAMFAEMIGSASLFSSIGDGGAVVGNGNFIWPSAASNYVTSPHGSRIHPITGQRETHLGIDIGAGAGTGVLASDSGSVISNSVHSSYGIHLLVDHGNGHQTLYAHMSAAHVGVGDTVEQGQIIGLVGSTGTSTNPHLHFEIRVNGSHVDPLQFFSNYTRA